MSLLRNLVRLQGGVKGGIGVGTPPGPTPPAGFVEYLVTEGTGSPFNVYYGKMKSPGFHLIGTSPYGDATGYNNNPHRIARTSDGTLYAVFRQSVKKSMDDGETWEDAGLSVDYQPSIVADPEDRLHIVWAAKLGYSFSQIWYSRYDGEWSTPVRISTLPEMDATTQGLACIVIAPDGSLHVVWRGRCGAGDQNLCHTIYDGSWHTPVWVTDESNPYNMIVSSLVVGGDGILHLIWNSLGNGYTTQQIWYSRYDGEWSAPVRISTGSQMSGFNQLNPSIAVDTKNRPHAVWRGVAKTYGYSQISYTLWDEEWGVPVNISTLWEMGGRHQYAPSIDVDSGSRPHVVWHDADDRVWYAFQRTAWQEPVRLQTGHCWYPVVHIGKLISGDTGILSVNTTPVKGEVFVDGISWGTAPQARVSAVGDHTISYGFIPGYTKPADQVAVVTKDTTTEVMDTYVVCEYEDFMAYIENDGDIDKTASRATFTTMRRDSGAYLYKDYGAGHFGDFEHKFTSCVTDVTNIAPHGSRNCGNICALTDGIGSVKDNNNDILCVAFVQYGSLDNTFRYQLTQREDGALVEADASTTVFNIGTYYMTLKRNGTSASLKIYKDASRTYLIETLSITCNKTTYQYLHVIQAGEWTTDPDDHISGYVENLEIGTLDTGTLSVDTNPVSGEVFVDGDPWGFAPQSREVTVRTYTVSFGAVAGYTTPEPQEAVVTKDTTTEIMGTYVVVDTGTLSVDTEPVKGEVFVEEESWGTAPQSQIVNVGSYTVSFGAVAGYTTPEPQEAVVTKDTTTEIMGTYVEYVPTEYEDFTAYTESDGSNRLSQTAARSTFTGLNRLDDNTYLYKDYGAGHFDDFTHLFEVYLDSCKESSTQWARLAWLSYVNDLNDWVGNKAGNKTQVGLLCKWKPGETCIYVSETYGGNSYMGTLAAMVLDTLYYCTLVKNGTSVTLNVYDDADRTNLVSTSTLTLQADHTLRYILCPQSLDYGAGSYVSTGYIQNLDLQEP